MIFRPLEALLKQGRKQRTEQDDALAAARIDQLIRARRTKGWDVFVQLVDNKVEQVAEELLNTSSTEHMWEARGRIRGLRESILVMEDLIHKKEQEDERDRLAAAAADKRSARRERLVRNTPFARRN